MLVNIKNDPLARSILDLTWPRNERAVVKSRRAGDVPDNAGIAHCLRIEIVMWQITNESGQVVPSNRRTATAQCIRRCPLRYVSDRTVYDPEYLVDHPLFTGWVLESTLMPTMPRLGTREKIEF
jgi:hypothetical protein